MDVGTAFTVAQTICAALQCTELRDFCSSMSYKKDLQELEENVETIKAVLRDAGEAKAGDLSHEVRVYVEKLKLAVYDADDLLDEFVTLAQRRKLSKVRDPIQYLKKCTQSFKMSREIKKIRENLTHIAQNHSQFKLELNHEPLLMRRETCSYVCSDDIIGRGADVEKILGMLPRDFSGQNDIFGLTIVGMGGLGKTALAQLVYNHKFVQNKFDLKLWVCVSDQDQKELNLKEILGKVLESALGRKHDASTLDSLLTKLKGKLQGRSYFLVLDDLWTELRGEWVELEKHLKAAGGMGCVLVTSRSKKTAEIVGSNGLMYELGGLSDDDSWHLFRTMAFQEENPSSELVEIGKKIIKRCKNVPLAIRAVGTLLYGRKKVEWEGVLETGLANIMYEKEGIMPILKLSYDNLDPSLKSCFSYCALFPKDFIIDKGMLTRLWMAQGYVMPLMEGQNIVAAAEVYFEILLRRCFFQDVEFDPLGDIESCKIHDLMHDIAIMVSKHENSELNSNMVGSLDERVRHVSIVEDEVFNASFIATKSRLRTYLQVHRSGGINEVLVERLVSSCTRLRTLDLRASDFENLPKCIGKLLHLRYLNLSDNKRLKVIPKSITKLHNLIFLGIEDCDELSGLPLGMDKLSNLEILERFIVGKASKEENHFFAELENLKSLKNLKGGLGIEITVPTKKICLPTKKYGRRGAYLIEKHHLEYIWISIKDGDTERCKTTEFEEALLEDMQPPSGLRVLTLEGYSGVRMPDWAVGDNISTSLLHLVALGFCECVGLQSLPNLEKLRYLKLLVLKKLRNLEYMEEEKIEEGAAESEAGSLSFPCLEKLELRELGKLKRWFVGSQSSPNLPRLIRLKIFDCPEMTSIPVCPLVSKLTIRDEDTYLNLRKAEGEDVLSSPQPSWELTTKRARHLKLMPTYYFQFVSSLCINGDNKVESLSDVEEKFQTISSSNIRVLCIFHCPELRSLRGCLEHLTALEELEIQWCPKLLYNNSEEEEEGGREDGIPWKAIAPNLRTLCLCFTQDVVDLPKGMQYLTSLQSLRIFPVEGLKSVPKWMHKLTSLTQLNIGGCSTTLKERCENPSGEDWPNIQHIPVIRITTEW